MGILGISREKSRVARQWKLLRAEPRPHGLAECARAFLALGDQKMAQDVLRFGLSVFPTSDELKRVVALSEIGETEDRLRLAKDQVRTTGSVAAYLELADAYRSFRRLDQYLETLSEAAERFPDNGTVLAMLSELRYRRYLVSLNSSDGAVAATLLERAAAADPDSLKPRFLLAELYARIGAFGAARAAAGEVLSLAPEHERAAELLNAVQEVAPEHSAMQAEEDLEILLAEVEAKGTFVGPRMNWFASESKPALAAEAIAEIGELKERTVARSAIYFDADGSDHSTTPDDNAATILRGLGQLCDRAARGMELGASSRLVMEGDAASCVLELKDGAGIGLLLQANARLDRAATAARDTLERVSRS